LERLTAELVDHEIISLPDFNLCRAIIGQHHLDLGARVTRGAWVLQAPVSSEVCVMGRAILTISGNAIALLPRPLGLLKAMFGGLWRELTRDAVRPYQPELHYMRGPGPAWQAKHGQTPRP
jgi:hypothetical protein